MMLGMAHILVTDKLKYQMTLLLMYARKSTAYSGNKMHWCYIIYVKMFKYKIKALKFLHNIYVFSELIVRN